MKILFRDGTLMQPPKKEKFFVESFGHSFKTRGLHRFSCFAGENQINQIIRK